MSWQVAALERVRLRLVRNGGLDELRSMERMCDEELLLLAEREAQAEARSGEAA